MERKKNWSTIYSQWEGGEISGLTSLKLNQQNSLANISYKYCIDQQIARGNHDKSPFPIVVNELHLHSQLFHYHKWESRWIIYYLVIEYWFNLSVIRHILTHSN